MFYLPNRLELANPIGVLTSGSVDLKDLILA